jgi:hypothetical protein
VLASPKSFSLKARGPSLIFSVSKAPRGPQVVLGQQTRLGRLRSPVKSQNIPDRPAAAFHWRAAAFHQRTATCHRPAATRLRLHVVKYHRDWLASMPLINTSALLALGGFPNSLASPLL